MKGHMGIGGRALALLFLGVLGAGAARAQTTTGTVRGTVKDETGAVLPGVSVEAVNDDNGFRQAMTTGGDGFFNLSLTPGPYTVTATLPSFTTETRKLRVLVGQTQSLDLQLKLAARASEAVTVSAEAPTIDKADNTIATNVKEEQIRNLPQNNRNFLNFAQLAPGVRLTDSANSTNSASVQVTASGTEAFNTNVFIDGTSFKNDVLQGGVVGQDSSRGNPFPQNAVQEFRVLTQNFKAEYEEAATAVITAVTKSGTNRIAGDAFVYYQNKNLVARDPFAVGQPKPDYTRYQAGADLGGPIIQDRLHYFVSYELNDQNRNSTVLLGSQAGNAPPALQQQLSSFTGQFTSPFRENLAFGKMSWQAASNSLLDFSGYYRHETDVKDFGSQTSFQSATDTKQDIWNAQGKYSLSGSSFLSETVLGYLSYKWNPQPTNPGLVGLNYDQILRIGGNSTTQNFHQKKFSVREDYSILGLHFAGDHVFKLGAVANFNRYDVSKQLNGNPTFVFNASNGYAFPVTAQFGFGNPDLSASNNQYGVYLQDDWTVNSRLTVNAGVRWDYETNSLDNNYVTPANVRAELSGLVSPDYFTDGSQRPAYGHEIAPRIGFTYDISGRGTTVAFGGYGRYFDRNQFNFGLDERYRLQYTTLNFCFSADGAPRPECPTIMWNPSFQSVAGLQGLVASGTAPKPEVFLINNNTKPPVNDQFSAGIRQSVGPVGISLSYAGVRGRNGFTFVFGNRRPDGSCCINPISPSFSNLLLSQASKRYWSDALYLQIEKPYTTTSKWGLNVAYTYGHSTQTGGDLFSLDYVSVGAYPRHSTQFDERHRVVLSGVFGVPFDIRVSPLITLGTGLPFTIIDASRGFAFNETRILLFEGRQHVGGTFPYQTWDLRIQKDVPVGPARVGVVVEGFNLTNHHNYGCFDGFIAKLPEINAHFGQPGCIVTDGRRGQVGLNIGF